ncbi:MAG: NAD(P)-dependent oxidoreductase [Lachnospiraceae bacterium]|nr:NAD(P)-dependent oxidoreductase [Lachnospiraceae bacterium]MCI9283631.1 NAD(P)-dependent oxidoreductase [Lachnospiraceae bacterium]
MRAVVTGATSFIGAAAIRQLLQAGHEVLAVVRPESSKLENLYFHIPAGCEQQIQILELDMREIGEVKKRISCPMDVWLHTCWGGAGSGNRTLRDVQQANVAGSLAAVNAAAEAGCQRFLFTGSQAEYGICHEKITEATLCRPVSEYGKAKLDFSSQAEKLCEELAMEYLHARIFSVYGPGDHPWSLVQSCLRTWSQGGEMLLGECTQWWNFLYIEDAAAALIALLASGKSGYYNVAGRDTRRLREFVEEMYVLCGARGSFIYGKRSQNAEGAADLVPDITKICAETGWEPKTPFAEGIYEILHRLPESASGKTSI